MDDQSKKEAAELAARSGKQIKHATQNAGRATETVIEGVAEDVVEAGAKASRRFNARGLSAIAGDAGVGFFALSVCLYSGAIAFSKFDTVIRGRGR